MLNRGPKHEKRGVITRNLAERIGRKSIPGMKTHGRQRTRVKFGYQKLPESKQYMNNFLGQNKLSHSNDICEPSTTKFKLRGDS